MQRAPPFVFDQQPWPPPSLSNNALPHTATTHHHHQLPPPQPPYYQYQIPETSSTPITNGNGISVNGNSAVGILTAVPSSSAAAAAERSPSFRRQLYGLSNPSSTAMVAANHFSSSTATTPISNGHHHKSGTPSSVAADGSGKSGSRTRQEYLKEIRESLQPFQNETYTNGGVTNGAFCDTLSSEGSSGTNGSEVSELESSMLNQLVSLGFHKENAWYALKLTQFRNVVSAAELLTKLQATNNIAAYDANYYQLHERLNDIESSSSRSESPLTRVASPYTPAAAWSHGSSPSSQTAAAAAAYIAANQQQRPQTSSASSTTSSYRSTPQQHLPNLAPGTVATAADANSNGAGLISSNYRLWPKRPTPVTSETGAADFSIMSAPSPLFQGSVHSTRVSKPIAQSAVAPTVISIGPSTSKQSSVVRSSTSPLTSSTGATNRRQTPTKVLAAHFEPNQPPQMVKIEVNQSQKNYRLESRNSGGDVVSVQVKSNDDVRNDVRLPPAAVQRIYVGGGNSDSVVVSKRIGVAPPGYGGSLRTDPVDHHHQQYIEQLCQRADGLLLTNHGAPEGVEPRRFSDILNRHQRQSPVSSRLSVSTDSSNDSRGSRIGADASAVQRVESPLPPSVFTSRNAGSCVQPCAPKAFRFFMEQHIENVLKQHRERLGRRMQLEKEMSVAMMGEREKEMMREFLSQKESHHLRLKRQRLNRSMFDRITTLGVGAFGEVNLVRKKAVDGGEGQLYAMKTLRKSDVIKLNQAAHVKAERDILSEADSEWIVKLYYSFQDSDNLYFVMEYIPGGDMMALLIKKEIFDEELARFYIAELVCAIEYVHSLGFIHRDIKPDNILIDGSGHIKLTDFGLCTGLRWTHDKKYYEPATAFAHSHQDSMDLLANDDAAATTSKAVPKVLHRRRQNKREKTHSLVGTTNYMAPEVLSREGHTQLCDWWSVGVILYEMVVGRPPFHADSPRDTQAMVIRFKEYLRFPNILPYGGRLSECAKDLIVRLCSHQTVRLGSHKGAWDIKLHSFFTGIDFNTIRSSPAPYTPPIAFPTDTSNFEPVEGHKTLTPSDAAGGDGADARFDDGQTGSTADSTLKKAGGGVGGDRTSTAKGGGSNPAFYEFTFRHFFQLDGHGCPTVRHQVASRPPLAPVFERPPPPPTSNSTTADHRQSQPSTHV